MKKVGLFIIILCLIILTGCSNSTDTKYAGTGTLNCTREGELEGGTASFSYTIKYKDGNILNLHSIEKVTSDNQNTLDIYENAYKNIFKQYKGLKYYENNIIRDENSVTSDTIINYEKIDLDALLKIEASNDNIIENGKAKLEKWLTFAEKFGTECE